MLLAVSVPSRQIELTGYTLLPPHWVCSDSGRSSPHTTDPPHPRCHTGNLNTHKNPHVRTSVRLTSTWEQDHSWWTLTLAAEVAVLLQVVVSILTGGAGSTAGVWLTVALARFLSGTRNMSLLSEWNQETYLTGLKVIVPKEDAHLRTLGDSTQSPWNVALTVYRRRPTHTRVTSFLSSFTLEKLYVTCVCVCV